MAKDGVNGGLVAVDEVEHTVGEAGLVDQFGEEHCGGRILLAGLQDEGVAAAEGVGDHPERHHCREVERGDAGDDAERPRIVVTSTPVET